MGREHPYTASGEPIIEESFCLLADVLGFSNRVCSCGTSEESLQLLKKMQRLITEAREIWDDGQDDGFHRNWEYALFSDTLVIGIPIRDCGGGLGEPELGSCLDLIGNYQLNLALNGFFVRGAMTVGELHMGSEMAFGKALVAAAQLEKHADLPRIILSREVQELVNHYLKWYNNSNHSPEAHDLLMDEDGWMFVDWLTCANYTGDGPDWSILQAHKEIIADRLVQFRGQNRILRKYEWLRDYHNYHCRKRISWSPDDWSGPPGGTTHSLLIHVDDGAVVRRFSSIASSRWLGDYRAGSMASNGIWSSQPANS